MIIDILNTQGKCLHNMMWFRPNLKRPINSILKEFVESSFIVIEQSDLSLGSHFSVYANSFQPCYLKDWEMHVQFKVHGSGKKNLHGDGIAIWYTKDRLHPGTFLISFPVSAEVFYGRNSWLYLVFVAIMFGFNNTKQLCFCSTKLKKNYFGFQKF